MEKTNSGVHGNDRTLSEEKALLERLKDGDKKAFDTVILEYSSRLFRQTHLLLGSSESAEEALQEIFLRAFTKIRTLKGSNVLSWLLSITHNHCVDQLRKGKRRNEFPTDFQDLEITVETNFGLPGDLPECLKCLSPLLREVFFLRVVEELGYGEISEITGFAEGTLRNAFSQALRLLRSGGSINDVRLD